MQIQTFRNLTCCWHEQLDPCFAHSTELKKKKNDTNLNRCNNSPKTLQSDDWENLAGLKNSNTGSNYDMTLVSEPFIPDVGTNRFGHLSPLSCPLLLMKQKEVVLRLPASLRGTSAWDTKQQWKQMSKHKRKKQHKVDVAPGLCCSVFLLYFLVLL